MKYSLMRRKFVDERKSQESKGTFCKSLFGGLVFEPHYDITVAVCVRSIIPLSVGPSIPRNRVVEMLCQRYSEITVTRRTNVKTGEGLTEMWSRY